MCELRPKFQKIWVFSLRRRTWFILIKSRCDWGIPATGPPSFCFTTLPCVERPINWKHMSKAYVCLLVNTVWTPRAELDPKNMAIRGRAVRRNYCLVSFSEVAWQVPQKKNRQNEFIRCWRSASLLWPFFVRPSVNLLRGSCLHLITTHNNWCWS